VRKGLQKQLWSEYVFSKQTFRELARDYKVDRRNIRSLFNEYSAPPKVHNPRPVNIVTDATYFGERKEDASWCVAVVRDPLLKENLVWKFADTESTSLYSSLREELENLGYTVLSVTSDGFSGIKSAFSSISYQMCHVHMERIVTRGTTRNPKTEAGEVLLALIRTLHKTTKKTFSRRLDLYIKKYRDFLNEKTISPLNNDWYWTHENLRRASLSLMSHRKYLFTYTKNKNIPKTTNSLEGCFSHVKDILDVHRGLSRKQKEKIMNTIFLASTIAPDKDKLDEIL
jgi:hypothetical protein